MANQKATENSMDTACLELGMELKNHQRDSIEAILEERDVFVTLPTGYGKSMIFHLLPKCARYLRQSKSPLVIVMAPFLSLMEEQISKINDRAGLGRAVQLMPGGLPAKSEVDTILFMFTSPEAY